MSDDKTKKNKHMSSENRLDIQLCLDQGMAFKAIASRIEKDPTTVSKEVKKHLHANPSEPVEQFDRNGNPLATHPCPRLLKAPFVCNGCKKRRTHCGYQKQLYTAKSAQLEYETLLSESREGIPLNKEAFYDADAVITAGIKKGQHLYHIMQSNDLGVSQSGFNFGDTTNFAE